MKKKVWTSLLLPALLMLLSFGQAKAQFFQGLLNTVKQTAQGRANAKASQTTNTAIDKAEHPGTPKPNPPSTPANTAAAAPSGSTTPAAGTNGSGTKPNPPGDKDSDSSFLTLSVSADRIISGTGVTISGSSIRFGNMKDVILSVDDGDHKLSANVPLTDSGHYASFQLFRDAGDYTITVQSSNRKSSKSITIGVFDLGDMDSIVAKPRAEMERAYDQVGKWTDQMKGQLSSDDATKLQGQMEELSKKKDMAFKVFDDIDQMGKTMDKIKKQLSGSISPALAKDLTALTDDLSGEARQMKTANDAAQHKSYDNTICEYIQMMSEACAAFSTVASFFSGKGELSLELNSITKAVALDKGVSTGLGSFASAGGAGDNEKGMFQELGKYCAAGRFDAESLGEVMSKAGFVGDMVSMCSDFFLKKYCGTMSGNLSQDYQCTYTNSNKVTWWEYTYHNEATIKLRYLRSAATPTMIKMKGNIEGNATKFTIYTKMSEMDDFKKAMKNRAQLYSVCVHVPATAPVATSQADASTNFGAVARAIVTPAYFNIPVDADYNPQTGELKIYCNDAIVDYSDQVKYTYCYIIIAAGIPLTSRVDFPIVKARLSIGKVIEKNNEFKMIQGADHNMSFTKQADFDLNAGSPIAHHISFNVSAKSD